jgi:phosphoglycerate dehydrogenase-like enzyme
MTPPARSDDLVIQTEHLSAAAASWLAERCDLRACAHDSSEFRDLLPKARGLVVRTYTKVNDELLARAPMLKVVGRAGVGLDNIDLPACESRGVKVVHTPDANTQAVVEYVVGLLSDALRPRVTLSQSIPNHEWNHLREITVGPRQMDELTLGVLGFGRVGSRVAEVARAIGFTVLFNDVREIPEGDRGGAESVSLERLFAACDVISLHIDGRPSNRESVNATLINRMKPDALLINTSRGFVIDNAALADFLRRQPQALAMLDVHEPEPFGAEYPLLGLANAKLYPHLASRTDTAMNSMSWVVRDVLAVLEGREPRFPASSGQQQ